MYHFFVTPDKITEKKVRITGPDVNHIKNVLRMKTGEEILISNGQGSDFRCVLAAVCDNEIICDIISETETGTEPSVKFYLFQGLPKTDKFEHIIRKAVELGVYEIIPTETARCVVKYDAKKQKSKAERWSRIAEGAAKQSHRGIIPEVRPVMTFDNALSYACGKKEEIYASFHNKGSSGLDMILIPYENYKDMETTKSFLKEIKPGMRVGIFIGPEGGFADTEVEKAIAAGARPVSLGNRILRTETAPLMLLSVLTFFTE